MNLYLLTQHTVRGWDTYDACVVVAENEEQARSISPSNQFGQVWANSPEEVGALLIGEALPDYVRPQVILSSFNAG